MRYYLLYIVIFFLAHSCASTKYLNRIPHKYGSSIRRVIWLQIAGIDREHIALTTFPDYQELKNSPWSKFQCTGQAWRFNLYKTTPSILSEMNSQLAGKKSMNGTCSDWKAPFVWKPLKDKSVETVFIESFNDLKDSFFSLSCSKEYHKSLNLMQITPLKIRGQDSVCSKKFCSLELREKAFRLLKELHENHDDYLFIIRDTSYANFLKNRKKAMVKNFLKEISLFLDYALYLAGQSFGTLVLVSSVHPFMYDISKNTFSPRGQLISPLWAFGAKAENFCGSFESSDILERILTVN